MGVIVITGARGPIGSGMARSLARAGQRLVLMTDLEISGPRIVATAQSGNGDIELVHFDSNNDKTINRVFGDVVQRHGKIDALINCADETRGTLPSHAFAETHSENWIKLLDINVHGVWNCCHAVLPYMIDAKHGNIVTVSEDCGLRGRGGAAIYSAAQGALIVFTQALAQEVGRFGIRANTVVRGGGHVHQTSQNNPMNYPLGRSTTGQDVGNAVAFLLSDRASHITGSCLDVTGGTALH